MTGFGNASSGSAKETWVVTPDGSVRAEPIEGLVAALVAAQAELPTALGKDSQGQIQNRTYKYLSLDKLIEATRPILTKHGLAIIQHPAMVEREADGGMVPALKTVLEHVSGEARAETMPLYLTDKSMQGLGSAITYARRYAWQSILGIAADEDTDAASEAVPF